MENKNEKKDPTKSFYVLLNEGLSKKKIQKLDVDLSTKLKHAGLIIITIVMIRLPFMMEILCLNLCHNSQVTHRQ